MLDVLKTLSGLLTPKEGSKRTAGTVKTPPPAKAPVASAVPDLSLSQAQAKEIILEAKDEALQIRRDAEEEVRRKSTVLATREGEVMKRLEEHDRLKKELIDKLERIAHLTRDEAREQILSALKDELRQEIAREIRESQDRAKEEAADKAREILVDAMRHGATDYVAEFTVSIIKVPDEEVKGRIIG